MKTRGRIWTFGDNIDTDVIIPATHLQLSSPDQLAAHCMEPINPGFAQAVRPGDIIVAGRNFGCGSSREHAPVAIKASGVAAVVAGSFARIFFRNAINIGLPVIECQGLREVVSEGDELEIDLDGGSIRQIKNGAAHPIEPYPPFIQTIIEHGGLMNFFRGMDGNADPAGAGGHHSDWITPEGMPAHPWAVEWQANRSAFAPDLR